MRNRFLLPAVTVFVCVLICGLFVSPAYANKKKTAATAADQPECRATLLLEPLSGEILKETNSHEPLPPASMVKLMLAYVVLKQEARGAIKLADVVPVSAACSKIGGSQVYLKQGEQFTVDQMLDAVLIQSANDAAVALAEYVGGTKEGFVEMMNAEAKSLGMNESEFHSPHGLPPGEGQEPDLISANDFGILSRALIKEFPPVLERTGTVESGFRDDAFNMSNHNHLLRSFPGCDGLKTGYYGQAGFSVAATAQRNGQRFIAIVMGCKERKKRDAEAARLLSLGFGQFRPVNIVKKGVPIEQSVAVLGGVKQSIVPITADELRVPLRPGDETKIERHATPCASLQAPVATNTPCGSIAFSIGERKLGTVELVAPEDVAEGGIVSKIRSKIGW